MIECTVDTLVGHQINILHYYDSKVEYIATTTAGKTGQGIIVDCPQWSKISIKFQFATTPYNQTRIAESHGNAGAWNVYLNGSSIIAVAINQDWKSSNFTAAQNKHLYTITTNLATKTTTVTNHTANQTKNITHTVSPIYKTGLDFFVRPDASDTSKYANARLYYCQTWDSSGNLLTDLIPVRYTDQGVSKGGLFDRISNQLFGGSGTGNITYGSDVS